MDSLKKKPIWTHCRVNASGNARVPVHGLGKTDPIPYHEAREKAASAASGSPHWGLVFTDESDLIGIDIDIDPTGKKANSTKQLPAAMVTFLEHHPTYMRHSLSGYGLHVFYRLTPEAKDLLLANKVMQGAISIAKGGLFNGDYRFRRGFLAFTDEENLYELSLSSISTISPIPLVTLLPHLKTDLNDTPMPAQKTKPDTQSINPFALNLPNIAQFRQLLDKVPSTLNRVAKRAVGALKHSKPQSNYEYWVLVGCACAHYSIMLTLHDRADDAARVEELFIDWSSKDKEGFTSKADVEEKYGHLVASTKSKLQADPDANVSTVHTIITLAKASVINFPDMITRGKKGNQTKGLRPDPSSTRNLQALMEHDEIELVHDPMAGGVCFHGPDELMTKWFCPDRYYSAVRPPGYSQVTSQADMAIRFRPYMQDRYSFSVSAKHAKDAVDYMSQSMRTENAFRRWVCSAPWDKTHRLDRVCDSIIFPDEDEQFGDVYRGYIKNALLSMVGIHFWPEDAPKIPAMLVLQGPENTYKSSWAEWLIPPEMKQYKALADIETAITAGREWQMFLSTKAVVVINECEPMFVPRYEQKVKACVDAEIVTYRDPYAIKPVSRPRTALIIGTTNKMNLYTGSNGTRKIWQIPVEECDSMLIKRMDLQQLYAEVYEQLKQYKEDNPGLLIQMAWAQTKEERQITNRLNAIKKGNDIGVLGLLIEQFGHFTEREFEQEDYLSPRGLTIRSGNTSGTTEDPNAWTVSNMFEYLRFVYPNDQLTRSSVKYALEEYSGNYTDSLNGPTKPFTSAKNSRIRRMVINRGAIRAAKSRVYYMMPPPLATVHVDNQEKVIEPNLSTVKESN